MVVAPAVHGESMTLFRKGFLLMLPLWAGALPAGAAFGIAALQAGLGPFDIQLMSLVVFSAAGQITAAVLIGEGSPAWLVVLTTIALNAQFLLISITTGRQLRATRLQKLVSAWVLTDASYGVSAAAGPLRLPVLLGAGICMYLGWNIGTALGLIAGTAIPDAERLGLSLVIPLSFLAVLVPLLKSRPALLAAGVSIVLALALRGMMPNGVAVLVAGLGGSIAGATMQQGGQR